MIALDVQRVKQVADELAPLCEGDEQLFHDMMTAETPVDHLIHRLHEMMARDNEMLVGIAERQDALAERKKRIETRVSRVKEQIGVILRMGRLTKLELPEVTYSIRPGKPNLVLLSKDAVPEEYQRIVREPDKTKINEAFAEAKTLPNWLAWGPTKDIVIARTQ